MLGRWMAPTALGCVLLPVAALAAGAGPNDPYYGVQWALHGSPASTDADQVWCASTGTGVLVADIDTGVDFGHPDLGAALVPGAAFTSGTSNPNNPTPDATGQAAVTDDYGHGTMTTGIMVARTGNGTGIAGESAGARALVMKVFSNKGGTTGYSAYDGDVSSAIVWAVQHGARVVNLSLGPSVPLVTGAFGDTIPASIQWAAQNGAAVAIAAGNSFIPAADYLDVSRYALVVGALGPSGAVAPYSQHGVGENIYAPGGDGPGGDPGRDVISTFPTYALPAANQPLSANVAPGYAAYDGTSFATPYAAGVLALLMAHGYTADQARQRILDTARTVGGNPAVDAPAAVGACPASAGAGEPPAASSGAPPAAGAAAQQGTVATASRPPAPSGRPSPAALPGGSTAPSVTDARTPSGPAAAPRGAPAAVYPVVAVVALVIVAAGVWVMAGRARPG